MSPVPGYLIVVTIVLLIVLWGLGVYFVNKKKDKK